MDRKFEKNQRQVPVSNGFRWLWPPNYPSTSPDQYERAFNFGGDVKVANLHKISVTLRLTKTRTAGVRSWASRSMRSEARTRSFCSRIEPPTPSGAATAGTPS